jgi:LysM repeat protein
VVTSGETWYGLADTYGTTMQALLKLNELERGAVLMVDQRIRVPAPRE